MLLATAWLIEKLKPHHHFLLLVQSKQCLSNIPIIFMTIPYIICIGSSLMKNDASDGNYSWLKFRIYLNKFMLLYNNFEDVLCYTFTFQHLKILIVMPIDRRPEGQGQTITALN